MSIAVVAGKPSIAADSDAITWAPISSPERLAFNGTSRAAVALALETAFGHFPIRLDKSHLPTLHGMAIGAGEGGKPYRDLHVALSQFGALEVTG